MPVKPPTIPIQRIVHTIQGEGTRAGVPCTIVRTLGCNLSCSWCDTPQEGATGTDMTVADVAQAVSRHACRLVEVTGGEPLLHPAVPALCSTLLAAGHEVLVETNGSLDVSALPAGVVRIVDLKPPSSGESGKNLLSNVPLLGPSDEVKIVIADEADHAWAVERLRTDLSAFPGAILLSPLTPGMDPGRLARWVLRDRLPARLNLQIHKMLGLP